MFRTLFLLLSPVAMFAQQLELSVPGQNLFLNNIAAAQRKFPQWDGQGVAVSVKEFRFDTSDVDFRGRVMPSPNAAATADQHASIMASLIGGAGNSDWRGKGVAPACLLQASSFVGLMPDADYGQITVQNHAYGVDIQNWYGLAAQAYDKTCQEHPALLHVFSAGNKGDSASISGPYAGIAGFANLSGNFKMAKNALIVGALDSLGRVSPRSSRGPAYDGRIKPELAAFGFDGSSGAAALVSGAAAAVQQALFETTDSLPDADLTRAILLNTAKDLGPPGPDFESGFGSLNLRAALETVQQKQFYAGIGSPGQTSALAINIPENAKNLRITLSWREAPAAPFAPKSLASDLDLQLLDPLGGQHQPWILNIVPHPDSLRQPARRGRDTLNNVEQCLVESPMPGIWNLQVYHPASAGFGQHFSLAWSFDTAQFVRWSYPLRGTPAPAGQGVLLQWETNIAEDYARLEWRDVRNAHWLLLRDSVPLQRGWERWLLPDSLAEVQLRLHVAGKIYNTDTFLIAPELHVRVGFNCPDSAMIFWNAAAQGATYRVSGLGQRYLEPLAVTTDTFFVFQKNAYPQPRFAVAALSPASVEAWQSAAPDINTQGVGCYFSAFYAEAFAESGVQLTLKIGADYALEKVVFEKLRGTQFQPIDEQSAAGAGYSYLDNDALPGLNTYRARLILDKGAELLSEAASVYFIGESSWRVFPNPAFRHQPLQVMAGFREEAEFTLYDMLGRQLLREKMENLRLELPLSHLPAGILFYEITEQGLRIGSGKLLLR